MNFKNNTLHTTYLFNGFFLLLVSYSFLPRWTLFDFYLKFNNKLQMGQKQSFLFGEEPSKQKTTSEGK